MDSSKSQMTKFLLLAPTKEKIGVSLILSLVFMVVILTIPAIGMQAAFLQIGLTRQILSCIVSFIVGFILYYPLACGLVYIFRVSTGKEKAAVRNLIPAVLFIIIFNPITFSAIVTSLTRNNQINSLPANTCGILITEVSAPTAKNAGLVAGEVIKTVNGYPVGTTGEIAHALATKKPNDTVTVITNAHTYSVILSTNPQNPQQVALGIKVKIIECGK